MKTLTTEQVETLKTMVWQNLLSSVLENILKETDAKSIANFIDNNFTDIASELRTQFINDMSVDDLTSNLIEDAAKEWIDQNYSVAFERAMHNMDFCELKDKVIDYLQQTL